MPDAEPNDSSSIVSPFPTVRDLYLLVAGLIVGILLGPAVLGRVSPGAYDRLFGAGGGEAARLVAEEDEKIRDELDTLRESGVTDVALQEHEARRIEATLPMRLEVMEERARGDRARQGWLTALVVAAAAVMAIEALVSPQPREGGRAVVSPMVGRLATARYALVALWLALAVAQPALLRGLPVAFTVAILAVVLLASLVPLGKRGA